MFTCTICRKTSKAGERSFKQIMETRQKRYPFRKEANRYASLKGEHPDDKGGNGIETVKERVVCEECVHVDPSV